MYFSPTHRCVFSIWLLGTNRCVLYSNFHQVTNSSSFLFSQIVSHTIGDLNKGQPMLPDWSTFLLFFPLLVIVNLIPISVDHLTVSCLFLSHLFSCKIPPFWPFFHWVSATIPTMSHLQCKRTILAILPMSFLPSFRPVLWLLFQISILDAISLLF